MMRHFAANALTVLIIGLLLFLGIILWGKSEYESAGPLTAPLRIEVEKGEALGSVGAKLAKGGAISDPRLFRVAARYTGQDAGLKFGEYEIPAGASMKDILALLNKGGNVLRQIIVPEGWTSWQVVELLNSREELTGEIAEVPAEGSLAPAGYDYQRGDDRNTLIARMQTEQDKILAEAWAGRAPNLPLKKPRDLLTLASIVEKETGIPEERGEVAAVFVNRLIRGMKLQTDPTVIYGVTGGKEALGRGLRASELAKITPYNTYAIVGLPPTPIANPGKAAIEAAAHPVESGFLYFVADGSGGHAFAKTLEEHNRNVVAWRRLEAERALQEKAAAEAGDPSSGDGPAADSPAEGAPAE